jgi:hypothetical protein
MSDIVQRLCATALDKDNFPRMKNERWLPVGLAKEAADEIERLTRERDNFQAGLVTAVEDNERLTAALRRITSGDHPGSYHGAKEVARRALEGK